MIRDRRPRHDRHALTPDGMILCNPRDKEAAHRAPVRRIAADDRDAVTGRKCLASPSTRHRGRKGAL